MTLRAHISTIYYKLQNIEFFSFNWGYSYIYIRIFFSSGVQANLLTIKRHQSYWGYINFTIYITSLLVKLIIAFICDFLRRTNSIFQSYCSSIRDSHWINWQAKRRKRTISLCYPKHIYLWRKRSSLQYGQKGITFV